MRHICARRGVLAIIAVISFGFGTSLADTSLFTTQDDWAQWTPGGDAGASLSADVPSDLDFTVTNGLGNAGSAQLSGTGGGLTVNLNGSQAFSTLFSPGEQANSGFLSTLSQAPTVSLDFTYPTSGTGYFQPFLILNYTGNFTVIAPTNTVNQGTFSTATYAVPAGLPSAPSAGLTYFQVGVAANSNESGPFVIDNMSAQPQPNVTQLFSAQDDWNQWSPNPGTPGIAATPGTSGDSDGSLITGVGNVTNPGQRGLAGGLTVTVSPGQGFGNVYSPDEHNNAAFLEALANASVAEVDFSYPPPDGSYFEPLLLLNYDGVYDPISPTSIVPDGIYFKATYPLPTDLPIDPDSLTYFQLGVIANTDETGDFAVDNIQVISAVPEPASLSIIGGAAVLLMRRRSRAN